jgi:fatty-acyl-CoA synthase
MTFLDDVRNARSSERGIIFLGEQPDRVSWQEMWDDATRIAAVFRQHGLKAGSHIAMLGNTSRSFVTAIEACWQLGATVMVLPVPSRMPSIDAFIGACRRRMEQGDADAFLIDADLAAFIPPPAPAPVVLTLAELADAARSADAWEPGFGEVERDAILQYTSGSTTEPKGVRVSYDVLESNCRDIQLRLGIEPDRDVGVSWLPLYHDMGLVGILATCMSRSGQLVLGSPLDFVTRPAMWFETISEYRGTITAGPNFAYALAARALTNHDGPSLDLSCLRVAINGAEPVRPSTMRQFVDAGAAHGLDPGCVFPAFGMAEIGIAGFFPPVGRGLTTEWVDPETLAPGSRVVQVPEGPSAREQVLCGTAVPGIDARVVGVDTRQTLPVRHVGELLLTGRGVSSGYYDQPDVNAERYEDGWLATGDLAYLTEDGEVVICGRLKDLIIVGGTNYYPQDVELAAATVEGVRPGNIVAFGVQLDDTEHLVVLAEASGEPSRQVSRAVRRAVANACGITPRDVVLCAKGSLPKTSSGKLQRSAARDLYLAGAFEPGPAGVQTDP